VALLLALPVLFWNDARGWPSVRLHLVERASAALPVAGENRLNQLVAVSSSSGVGHLESFLRVLVGQLFSYSPLLAPLLVWGIWHAVRRARSDDRDLFLAAFSVPVLVPLLAAMTRFQDAEQHWTMMALMPGAIAAGRMLDEGWSRVRVAKGLAAAGVAVSAIGFVLALVHVKTTAILRLLPAAHYDPRADIANELVGWSDVRASVTRAADAAPGKAVLASSHYSLCGRLFFETGDWPTVYCPTTRRSAFDFFGRHDLPADATVVVLTNDIHDEMPLGLEGRTCTMTDEVDVDRGGRQVARYYVRSCPPVPTHEEERASRD
jgi:hypothetical protein